MSESKENIYCQYNQQLFGETKNVSKYIDPEMKYVKFVSANF